MVHLTDEQFNSLNREALIIIASSLQSEVDSFKSQLDSANKKLDSANALIADNTRQIELLTEQIRLLTQHHFGRKSESNLDEIDIWMTTELRKHFDSSLDILDEMRSIRYVEHTNKAKLITPFVRARVDICDAFELAIPDGCSPDYRSKRKGLKRRGRPRKTLTEREV